jgi:hypothetical protein
VISQSSDMMRTFGRGREDDCRVLNAGLASGDVKLCGRSLDAVCFR